MGFLRRHSQTFCKHRWTIIKRWTETHQLLVIQRCRWCDKWQRKEIELKPSGERIETVMETTPIIEKLKIESASSFKNQDEENTGKPAERKIESEIPEGMYLGSEINAQNIKEKPE